MMIRPWLPLPPPDPNAKHPIVHSQAAGLVVDASGRHAFVVSRDGGGSWGTPRLISPSRWHPDWLSMSRQGAGLRDRAEPTAGGRVFYAYGDGRNAALKPSSAWGRCLIYGAVIDLG